MRKHLKSSITNVGKIKQCISNPVLICIAFLILQRSAFGQHWTQVHPPSGSFYGGVIAIAPYFLNENIGFIFQAPTYQYYTIDQNLFRTTDGGTSWKYIPYFDGVGCLLQQIYFVTASHGYAAGSNGIYETNDTGSTWKKISISNALFSSVYSAGQKVYGFIYNPNQSLNFGPLISTSDDGIHWDTVITASSKHRYMVAGDTMNPYVFGNKDSIVFAEKYDSDENMYLVHSTDNGKNWVSIKIDSFSGQYHIITQGLYCFPHCTDILRTYIVADKDNDVYPILHSSDYGSSFETYHDGIEITAWITGNQCTLYVSNAGTNFVGFYRSTDKGKLWNEDTTVLFDFNEMDDRDFHNLSVVGGGAVVYACDVDGQLWKTSDGGDGSLSVQALVSHIGISYILSSGGKDTLFTSVCDSSSAEIYFENISCNYATLQDFKIEGLDSSEYSTHLKHHSACAVLPDTILIQIHSSTIGTRDLIVHSHFINDEYYTIDTNFSFTLATASVTPSKAKIYLSPSNLNAFAGDTVEIPLYINSIQYSSLLGRGSVDLAYKLNPILLTPINFKPVAGIIADPIKTTNGIASVTLHFAPGFSFMGEAELGRLRCAVYLTDTLESDIILSGSAYSTGCVATSVDSNTIHFTLSQCGAPMISNFMKYGKAYDILSIIPNPAGNFVQVQLKNNGSLLHYELLDALGALQKSGTTTENKLQINLSGLSSGNYYFRLSGEGAMPITKTLVIIK